MLTIEGLQRIGADTDDGLQRCMNDESFYLGLVDEVLRRDDYDKLKRALADGDIKGAFETAHTMKGVYANLSLKSLYDPVSEITEKLRAAKNKAEDSETQESAEAEYSEYTSRIGELLDAYRTLLE